MTGYDGGDELWEEQYEELCRDYGWIPDVGVNEEVAAAGVGGLGGGLVVGSLVVGSLVG